jgi:hypothetical protein
MIGLAKPVATSVTHIACQMPKTAPTDIAAVAGLRERIWLLLSLSASDLACSCALRNVPEALRDFP